MNLVTTTAVLTAATLATAASASATLYTLEFGHSHIGIGFGEMPADPRDRDSDPTNDVNQFLNADGGLFPHIGIPGEPPNADTNLPVNGAYGQDQVTVLVPASTAGPRRVSPTLDTALGNSAGDTTWVLPESDIEAALLNAPWFGPEVEEEAYEAIDDPDNNPATGNLRWTLENVQGPGEVALWVNDSFGEVDLWMGSADGLDATDGIDLFEGAIHNFWGFTAPGEYFLTFGFGATVDGVDVSESGTFRFFVVPTPGTAALLPLVAAAGFRRRRA